MPALSTQVRDYRLGRMRDVRRRQSFDVLRFTSAEFFEFASNHGVSDQAWERPYLLAVPIKGAPFAFMADHNRHHIQGEIACGTSLVDDVVFYAETPRVSGCGWLAPQWREMVADHLHGLSLSRAWIGFGFTTAPLAGAAALLPELRLLLAGSALRQPRSVKHPEELATMLACASLSDYALDCYWEELRPSRFLQKMDHVVAARLATEAAPRREFRHRQDLDLERACIGLPTWRRRTLRQGRRAASVGITTVAARLNGLVVEGARTWLTDAPTRNARHCSPARMTPNGPASTRPSRAALSRALMPWPRK